MAIDLKRLSKIMAHALRHAPEQYHLDLDQDGWVEIEDLLSGLHQRKRWRNVTIDDFEAVVTMPGKKRYEMENGRIRALYGHSTDDKIRKIPVVPPEILYHGTPPATAEIILREGLKPMNRQYVHLSMDVETAVMVGGRRSSTPIVLRVNALAAHNAGIQFYEERDLIWLADIVPPEFISKD